MGEGEDLGTVGERNRAFTRGVESAEHEHEESDERSSRCSLFHQSAQTGRKQSPHHLRESEEEQRSSSESVDGPESGESEEPVDETETERAQHGLKIVVSSINEDSGRVKGDDVNTTHLLCNHNSESGDAGTAHAGDGEELCETGYVVTLARKLVFDGQLSMDVVNISGNLDWVVP